MGPIVKLMTAKEASANQPGVDLARIERAVREILLAFGEDPEREGLLETPKRVAKAYAEMLSGQVACPAEHLGRMFDHAAESDDVVILRDIPFSSLCEHHLLPFQGQAHVAYLPSEGKVVGLSKLARTVDTFAKRLQLQERLTAQIADALAEHLSARGVLVVLEGEHLCMTVRGAEKDGAVMTTTAARGVLKSDAAWRREIMSLLLR